MTSGATMQKSESQKQLHCQQTLHRCVKANTRTSRVMREKQHFVACRFAPPRATREGQSHERVECVESGGMCTASGSFDSLLERDMARGVGDSWSERSL